MSFCPRCGAAVTPAATFCPACGGSLAPRAPLALTPAAAARPAPAPAPPAPDRPRGRAQEPWLVVILCVLTLGAYSAIFWWRASREIDAYTGQPGRSHGLVRVGIVASAIAALVVLASLASFLAAAIAAEDALDRDALVATLLGSLGMMMLGLAASFAGAIVLLVGKHRLWESVEQEERRGHAGAPLSAGLMVGLTLASLLVPFVGFVLPLVVIYLTQEHLNRLWTT